MPRSSEETLIEESECVVWLPARGTKATPSTSRVLDAGPRAERVTFSMLGAPISSEQSVCGSEGWIGRSGSVCRASGHSAERDGHCEARPGARWYRAGFRLCCWSISRGVVEGPIKAARTPPRHRSGPRPCRRRSRTTSPAASELELRRFVPAGDDRGGRHVSGSMASSGWCRVL